MQITKVFMPLLFLCEI